MIFDDAEHKIYHIIDRDTGEIWSDEFGVDRWGYTASLAIANSMNGRRDHLTYVVKEVADERIQWIKSKSAV